MSSVFERKFLLWKTITTKKIWDIANDDLIDISIFFGKIKATARGAYSCLVCSTSELNEQTDNVLYMLDVIEDLTDMADKNLSKIAEKLCAIYRKTKESKVAK